MGIIAKKTERTQIHFLSDVLVAVASLDLKVQTLIAVVYEFTKRTQEMLFTDWAH